MGLRVEERIANAICKNPRIMKAGITLEFKEVITRVSRGMMSLNITTCNKNPPRKLRKVSEEEGK